MLANFKQQRKQAGDTIVEVMIVVAILGLAFGVAYATATHSLNKTRNAEEHSEALQYINSQVELLRNEAVNPSDIQRTSATFCMDPATDKAVPSTDTAHYAATCNVGTANMYQVTINYQSNITGSAAPQDDVYKVTVSWPGLADLGPQQEHMYYKVHAL